MSKIDKRDLVESIVRVDIILWLCVLAVMVLA